MKTDLTTRIAQLITPGSENAEIVVHGLLMIVAVMSHGRSPHLSAAATKLGLEVV